MVNAPIIKHWGINKRHNHTARIAEITGRSGGRITATVYIAAKRWLGRTAAPGRYGILSLAKWRWHGPYAAGYASAEHGC